MPAFDRELAVAQAAAAGAGAILRRRYAELAIRHELKADGSPVSAADLDADAVIAAALRAAFPDDVILSEESPDEHRRLGRSRVWIVDPLDGTRDFLARTGDFCVHVGLVVDGVPTVGVVYHPADDALYHAVRGYGGFVQRGGGSTRLAVSSIAALGDVRVGVSRHNLSPALVARLDERGLSARVTRLGASVKYLALARGDLDAVLTITGREKEWDTCAPEVIVVEAGGRITDGDGQPLRYNQPDLDRRRGIVVSNGRCHDELLALVHDVLPETAA